MAPRIFDVTVLFRRNQEPESILFGFIYCLHYALLIFYEKNSTEILQKPCALYKYFVARSSFFELLRTRRFGFRCPWAKL